MVSLVRNVPYMSHIYTLYYTGHVLTMKEKAIKSGFVHLAQKQKILLRNTRSYCCSQRQRKRISLSWYVMYDISLAVCIATLFADQNMIDQLLSPSLLHFYRTGAERHQLSPDDEEDIEVSLLAFLHY